MEQKYCATWIECVCWPGFGSQDPLFRCWSVSLPWTTAQESGLFHPLELLTAQGRNVLNRIPLLMDIWVAFGFALRISAAVNICTRATVSLEKMWRTVIAESQGMHGLRVNRCCQTASKVAVPINTPTNSVCESGFPTLLPTLNSTSIFGIWILCEALMRWWGGEEAKEDVSSIRHGVTAQRQGTHPLQRVNRDSQDWMAGISSKQRIFQPHPGPHFS